MRLDAAHRRAARLPVASGPAVSLVHMRRAGKILLVLTRCGTETRLWRIATADSPGVALMSATDRAQVEGAVRTLHREREAQHGIRK